MQMGEEIIRILETPDAYWTNRYRNTRTLVLDGKERASIELSGDQVIISIGEQWDELPFDYDEWEWDNEAWRKAREKDGAGGFDRAAAS